MRICTKNSISIKYKVILTFMLICLTFPNNVKADIWGTTTIKYKKTGQQNYINTRQLLNSEVRRSPIDCLSGIYDLVNAGWSAYQAYQSSNPVAAVQAADDIYRSILSVSENCSDKSDFKRTEIELPADLKNYDEIIIEFEINSNNDPLWPICVGAPRCFVGGSCSSSDGQESRIKSRKATVKIIPTKLPWMNYPAVFPVMFKVKENDCSMCASITHAVFVRIKGYPYEPAATEKTCWNIRKKYENNIAHNRSLCQGYQRELNELVARSRQLITNCKNDCRQSSSNQNQQASGGRQPGQPPSQIHGNDNSHCISECFCKNDNGSQFNPEIYKDTDMCNRAKELQRLISTSGSSAYVEENKMMEELIKAGCLRPTRTEQMR